MNSEPLPAADGSASEPLVPPLAPPAPPAQAAATPTGAAVAPTEAAVAPTAEPVAPPEPPTTTAAPTTTTAPAVPATEARPTSRRRLMLLAGLGRLARFGVMAALFAAGVALGYANFLANQPVATPTGDPVTTGMPTPAVVQEVIAAIASNDADRIRAAVPADPYQLLTRELERWEFQQITSVETLSTYVDGPRSSTEIIIVGRARGGNPININLVVHADGGKIVTFR